MLVNRIADRLIQFSSENSKFIKVTKNIELSSEGVFKVLEIYESVFTYRFKQAKTTISKIELYRERIGELKHLRGMSADIIYTIDKRIINTWYKLNKYQQKWKMEHEL